MCFHIMVYVFSLAASARVHTGLLEAQALTCCIGAGIHAFARGTSFHLFASCLLRASGPLIVASSPPVAQRARLLIPSPHPHNWFLLVCTWALVCR